MSVAMPLPVTCDACKDATGTPGAHCPFVHDD